MRGGMRGGGAIEREAAAFGAGGEPARQADRALDNGNPGSVGFAERHGPSPQGAQVTGEPSLERRERRGRLGRRRHQKKVLITASRASRMSGSSVTGPTRATRQAAIGSARGRSA